MHYLGDFVIVQILQHLLAQSWVAQIYTLRLYGTTTIMHGVHHGLDNRWVARGIHVSYWLLLCYFN